MSIKTKVIATNAYGDRLYALADEPVTVTSQVWRTLDMSDQPQMLGGYLKFDPQQWTLA